MTVRKTLIIAALALALGACNNKSSSDDKAAKPGAKPGTGGTATDGTKKVTPPGGGGGEGVKGADPIKDWTLDQATAGLAGDGKKLMAKISTSKGDITCELMPDLAPKTVASFVGLARGVRPWQDPDTQEWVKKPFFDGLAFHRVIPGFMIQGGDPLSRKYSTSEMIGTGSPGYTVDDEFQKKVLFDQPGRLAMAHSQMPDSGGSQFFITDGKTKALDGKYTIFGQCENVDVVHAIAGVPVGPPNEQGGMGPPSRPTQPITMTVEIFKR